jgi:hypothetical protein
MYYVYYKPTGKLIYKTTDIMELNQWLPEFVDVVRYY